VLFGAYFGRYTLHRMLLAYHLESNHNESSLVVFQPNHKWVEFETDPLKDYFARQLQWSAERVDTNKNFEGTHNGCVDHNDCLPIYHEIFGRYAIEIVVETSVYDMGWFTEKTTKCLAAGKPFILFGTLGQLQYLQDMGFETFGSVIDESYDQEPNVEKRFDMVCKEIDRIANHANDARDLIIKKLYQIAARNKNNYRNLVDQYYRKTLS